MKTSRIELNGVFQDGEPVQDPVVVTAAAFGEPGIDIWVNDKPISLSRDHCKQLSQLLDDQYGGVSCTFTLYDDESVKKKLTVMEKWDAMMDDARNSADFGVMVDDYLQLGKKYRITITEVQDG